MWGMPPNPYAPPPLDLPPLRMPPMAAAVQAKPQSHAFFREGGPGRTIIGIIADALAGATGGQGTYAPLMLQKRREQMLEDRDIRQEERKARAPIRDMIGDDYVEIDPTTGTAKVLYHGQPKLDEFGRALQNANIPEAERPGYWRKKLDNEAAPKIDWQMVTDPVTGAKSLIPTPRSPQSAAAPSAGPAPGTVKNGYRFKGGNPADPSAWEPVGGPTPQASGAFR